jgi:sialate O-acetylesterase
MNFKLLLILFIVLCSARLHAQQLVLPGIFSDHMILQRGMEPPIWGRAKANTNVIVLFNGFKKSFPCNSAGNWSGRLPEPKTGKIYTITIINENEKISISDVIGGDIFYAGGQSNMQYSLEEATGGQEAINSSANNSIRLFTVPGDVAYKPRFDINRKAGNDKTDGKWLLSSPENVKNFSAVAYFFARKVNAEEKVPVGIINVSWGGTPIEAHMSEAANRSLPYYVEALDMMKEKSDKDSLVIDKSKATPQLPSSLYNAMIHPLIPFGLKGFLWYQGEHNWNNPFRYREQFISFINDLRIQWKCGYLPFYFVQLPNVGKKSENPNRVDFWSVLRESQSMALRLPHTGMVVSADIGDGDLHPKNKLPFGERLAALALRNIYHKNISSDGPILTTVNILRDTVELTFDAAESTRLQFKGPISTGFAIAGSDKKFYWAKAVIKGNKVHVSSQSVLQPYAVRYGWGENPELSLFDSDGWPVAPFRTDKWALPEDGKW